MSCWGVVEFGGLGRWAEPDEEARKGVLDGFFRYWCHGAGVVRADGLLVQSIRDATELLRRGGIQSVDDVSSVRRELKARLVACGFWPLLRQFHDPERHVFQVAGIRWILNAVRCVEQPTHDLSDLLLGHLVRAGLLLFGGQMADRHSDQLARPLHIPLESLLALFISDGRVSFVVVLPVLLVGKGLARTSAHPKIT
ncbi:hypothetical protein H114_23730 [Streptomyces gancidicus BKS 13-15]|uniref:Uncharacterized protein n=1 Tax=Streptomyces gancidicus BKS 13-15 TaxID=1284664 RepID=M3D9R1_STREZ|nr:hypothetical protein H114_23730 [Streptomyces gancidicus BKS 13-15]